MTRLCDQWLIDKGKTTLETKAYMKKAINAKKTFKKTGKSSRKGLAKNQSLHIRRLALPNSHM